MYSFEKCFNNFLFRGTTPEEHIGMVVLYDFIPREPSQHFKMESIRKLSNQWTKILYQKNLKYIAFFFILFKSYRRN